MILPVRTALIAGLASLALTGCASLPGGNAGSGIATQALGNLEHCKRTYQASIGGLGVPGGSLYIECAPKPFEEPVE